MGGNGTIVGASANVIVHVCPRRSSNYIFGVYENSISTDAGIYSYCYNILVSIFPVGASRQEETGKTRWFLLA